MVTEPAPRRPCGLHSARMDWPPEWCVFKIALLSNSDAHRQVSGAEAATEARSFVTKMHPEWTRKPLEINVEVPLMDGQRTR